MGSFAKYIGGSPTDTAGGTARLGLRSAVITRGAVSGSPSSAKLVQSVQHSSRQLPKVRTRFWVNLTPAARAIRASVVFPRRQGIPDRVAAVIELLESLDRPKAFAVRLLNPDHQDYASVEDFFDVVAKPVLEYELGYRLIVINGRQTYDHARIDQEIFAKLHRSSVVLADITGARPNCFLELGYALGRGLPTIVTAREGADLPFDIATFAGHHWKASGTADDRRRAFREHWNAIRNRPTLVPTEPLIS